MRANLHNAEAGAADDYAPTAIYPEHGTIEEPGYALRDHIWDRY